MTKRSSLVIGLGVGLAIAACRAGPSSSASDKTAEQDEVQSVERRAGFLGDLLSRRRTAARLMDDITSSLPDRVRLIEGVYGSAEVRLKGYAPSNNHVADYLARLGRSAVLAEVTLQSSVQKSGRGGEYQEFALRALVRDPGDEKPGTSGSPTARLGELEKMLPGRGETADMLREFQTLALGSGLKMTRFVPGKETPGEFYAALPVAIEVTGSPADLGRYFNDLAASRRLWLVEKFSFKNVSPQDARSPLRASITMRTYLPR